MRTAVLLLTLSTLVGCSAFDSGCTDIGGINGITLEIPEALFVTQGSVEFEVCDDDGCAHATTTLGRMPKDVSTPVGRATEAAFDDLDRSFDEGTVQVLVELRDSTGRLLAKRGSDVELKRSWPNGKACDGDGYLHGTLELRPEDAVPAPS
jgi:hypothetical protein